VSERVFLPLLGQSSSHFCVYSGNGYHIIYLSVKIWDTRSGCGQPRRVGHLLRRSSGRPPYEVRRYDASVGDQSQSAPHCGRTIHSADGW
jgi:hypothetical protein